MKSFRLIPIGSHFRCNHSNNLFVKIELRKVVVGEEIRIANAFDLSANRLVRIATEQEVIPTYVSFTILDKVEGL